VLEAIYLIFNEGYAGTAGDDVLRPQLVEDALRLGRVLATLVPDESEAHGLVALMELHASRVPTRTGPAGEPVLLADDAVCRVPLIPRPTALTISGRVCSMSL